MAAKVPGRAKKKPAGAPQVIVRSAAFHFPENGISTLALTQKETPHRVFMMRERRAIGSRYIRLAGPEETPSVLATTAAEKALAKCGMDAKDLDMVVTAGCTPPDFDMWSMPAKVARNIGASNAECFGFGESACAAPFAAIRSLLPMMRDPDGPARVMMVAGCVTPGGHFFEPATIYGDGGGAIILERTTEPGMRIVRADYYTNYKWVDAFGPAAGVKKLKAEGKLEAADWTVRIKNQKEVNDLLDGTGDRGAAFVKKTLAKEGWSPKDLRWLIGDNVAAVIPMDMAAALGVPEDRILLENCTRYGHAWVVDLFVNLATILDERPLATGERVACVGMGQGENWGVFLLEAPAEKA